MSQTRTENVGQWNDVDDDLTLSPLLDRVEQNSKHIGRSVDIKNSKA